MSLDEIPAGTTAFVDSTILHYAVVHFESATGQCIRLLERVAKQELSVCLNVSVLNDAIHKVMCSEAQSRFQRPRAGLVRWMKENPELVRELTMASNLLNLVAALPVRMLAVDQDTLFNAQKVTAAYGLLASDAIIVAQMQRHGISHLATNDDDFDRVPGINVWKPRSIGV